MSTMLSRALMVMRSLSLKTHSFTLCVIAGTLILCLGFFHEPNIDISHTTTSVQKEMETASASNLTIDIEVSCLTMNADETGEAVEVIELNQLVAEDEIDSDKSNDDISFDDYLEFARLVEAEAATEDLIGKTYVANVVTNRLESKKYPDTLTEVINDPGQFGPVDSGYINYVVPTHEAKLAVMKALSGVNNSKGALYFQKSKATEWGDKTFLFRYGAHSFYK